VPVVPNDMYHSLDVMIDWPMRYVHQGCDMFGEGPIRINIVPNGAHTNTSPLVQAMDSKN
jgi:hypothetical protein